MSREFGDNLTKDDVKTIADVRRDVWTSGFKGMGYGSAGGYILHTITRVIHRNLSEAARGKLILPGSDKPIRFNRNTAFFSVMAGSALGSFLMATTTGKNEVHQLHSIFEIGKNEYKTPYQKFYEEGKAKVEESEEAREKRRLSRRKTVSKRLTEGQGLSDSHSGTWIEDEKTISEDEKRRSARKVSMSRRLDKAQEGTTSRM